MPEDITIERVRDIHAQLDDDFDTNSRKRRSVNPLDIAQRGADKIIASNYKHAFAPRPTTSGGE